MSVGMLAAGALAGGSMGTGAAGGWPIAAGGRLAAACLLLAVALLMLPRRRSVARWRLGDVAIGAASGRTTEAADGATGAVTSAVERSSNRTTARLPVLCGLAVGSLAAVLTGGGAGALAGVLVGAAAVLAARRWIRGPASPPTEPLRLAGAWDLLAACLRAGLPVAAATGAVADRLPGRDGDVLRLVAGLLASGADAADAWQPALANPRTAALAMAARRTARSGAALAGAVSELAAKVRADAADLAQERAQRAGVLITGPLGLCFLPAFFCLGVLPVIIGLAGELIQHW